ncbi:uncharacterized protein LOC111242104 [Vigna radiata var. radiata]|uniref:Uncharacterized protein LOC111242104 n=1 Tax=Vigna radiata var. radiata TaxID=3916 RepID=A0A3Q0F7U4_VIGRR|nr:uncharacterized protein LOC111242104 [Vigna radiata var. radiata]
MLRDLGLLRERRRKKIRGHEWMSRVRLSLKRICDIRLGLQPWLHVPALPTFACSSSKMNPPHLRPSASSHSTPPRPCAASSPSTTPSPQEIVHLHRNIIRSKSVSSLNSRNVCFLLTLACVERLEDLNLVVATISRLAARCFDQNLASFEVLDARKLEFGTREVQKKIKSMEKLVFATRSLHKAMECDNVNSYHYLSIILVAKSSPF